MKTLAASGLAAALAASVVAPSHRDDYPYGYRAAKRAKPVDVKRAAKRNLKGPTWIGHAGKWTRNQS